MPTAAGERGGIGYGRIIQIPSALSAGRHLARKTTWWCARSAGRRITAPATSETAAVHTRPTTAPPASGRLRSPAGMRTRASAAIAARPTPPGRGRLRLLRISHRSAPSSRSGRTAAPHRRERLLRPIQPLCGHRSRQPDRRISRYGCCDVSGAEFGVLSVPFPFHAGAEEQNILELGRRPVPGRMVPLPQNVQSLRPGFPFIASLCPPRPLHGGYGGPAGFFRSVRHPDLLAGYIPSARAGFQYCDDAPFLFPAGHGQPVQPSLPAGTPWPVWPASRRPVPTLPPIITRWSKRAASARTAVLVYILVLAAAASTAFCLLAFYPLM